MVGQVCVVGREEVFLGAGTKNLIMSFYCNDL